MPRNLTDLMEAAVSAAPPEIHHASDITHLAERAQRRRTTFVAGAAALAVIAAAGGTFGLTRGHTTAPEPTAPYKYDQRVDVSSAAPASRLPGYDVQPWTIPSMQRFGADFSPLGTYQDIDAAGRLVVEDAPSGDPQGPLRIRIFDGPGQAPRDVQVPPAATTLGRTVTWVPSFVGDGRLLWKPSPGIVDDANAGIYVTDLDGGHAVFVHTSYEVADQTSTIPTDPRIAGDKVWFTSFDTTGLKSRVSYSLYAATFSGDLTKVADKVAAAHVGDGTVVWITTDGRVMTESADGGSPREVPVPLPAGCRMPSTLQLQGFDDAPVATSSVISVPVRCGKGDDATQDIIAFDPTGRLLVDITGAFGVDQTLGQDDLVFGGLGASDEFVTYRYDLVTGTLVRLAGDGKRTAGQKPQAAGDYVLWYDGSNGRVARFGE